VAYDPELDLLYIGTGNGSPWNQRVRSANRRQLFLFVDRRPASDTGEYVGTTKKRRARNGTTATQHIVA
jgi:hypothetical protein